MKKLILSILGCLLNITLSAHHLSFVVNVADSDNETVISTSNESSFDLLSFREKREKSSKSKKDKNITRQEEISENEKDDPNTVTLVVTGEGSTKEEATKNALRSAIEQAFGTFVSANTKVLNDELVKDEIVTISTGNIRKYKEVYFSEIGSTKSVTLQATVSIGNLVSYAKNKGMQAELSGATFLMNKKMRDLNRENEVKALNNLYAQLCIIAANGLFDYEIKLGEPREMTSNKTEVPINIVVKGGENLKNFINCLKSNISSLKMSSHEIEEYRSVNAKIYNFYFLEASFRSKHSEDVIDRVRVLLLDVLLYGFEIKDNLKNSFYYNPNFGRRNIYKEGVFELHIVDTYDYDLYRYGLDYDRYIQDVKVKENYFLRGEDNRFGKYYQPYETFICPWYGKIIYNNSDLQKLSNIEIAPNDISGWLIP